MIEVDKTVFSVFTGNHLETINSIEILNSSGVSALEIIRAFLKWSITLKIACDIYKNSKSIDIAIKDLHLMCFGKYDQNLKKVLETVLNLDLSSIIDRLLTLEKKS